MSALIGRELASKVTVREGGREITVTKREVMAKQLVNKAVAGDPRALKTITDFEPASPMSGQAAPAEARTEALSATERGLLEDHLAYLDLKHGGEPPDE